MKTKISGAKFSSIVKIGETLKQLSEETGLEYLPLNRGVNAVCLIDLKPITDTIDFNTTDVQVYPPNNGRVDLRNAINEKYFHNCSNINNMCITTGGMNSLSLILSTLDTEELVSSEYYWGAYRNISIINNLPISSYPSFEWLIENVDSLKNKTVIICDPNNPIGDSYSDRDLMNVITELSKNDITTIWDGPYRKLFTDDDTDEIYKFMLNHKNVIISESFSKSIGLSGQRLGFIHSTNDEFNKEISTRLLYDSNGVNATSQIIVQKLLTTEEGKKSVNDFKETTVNGIKQNISFLKENGLLCEEFYVDSDPVGIFVVINRSYDELLENRIGSVPLSFFTSKEIDPNLSRICVSVDPTKFREFFQNMLNG